MYAVRQQTLPLLSGRTEFGSHGHCSEENPRASAFPRRNQMFLRSTEGDKWRGRNMFGHGSEMYNVTLRMIIFYMLAITLILAVQTLSISERLSAMLDWVHHYSYQPMRASPYKNVQEPSKKHAQKKLFLMFSFLQTRLTPNLPQETRHTDVSSYVCPDTEKIFNCFLRGC